MLAHVSNDYAKITLTLKLDPFCLLLPRQQRFHASLSVCVDLFSLTSALSVGKQMVSAHKFEL